MVAGAALSDESPFPSTGFGGSESGDPWFGLLPSAMESKFRAGALEGLEAHAMKRARAQALDGFVVRGLE